MTESPTARVTLDRPARWHEHERERGRAIADRADRSGARPGAGRCLLAALRAQGITAAELRGFAQRMRAIARRPELPRLPDAVDIVGTGGDRSGSLNLSTGGRCSRLPAVCRYSNMAIVRSRARGQRRCARGAGPAAAAGRGGRGPLLCGAAFTFLFAPTTTRRPKASRRCVPRWVCARCSISWGP